jgi:hypothetical protein
MAKRFLTNIDLEKNEIQNVVVHKLATAPSAPVEGTIYYNTNDERFYIYRTTGGWKDITGRLDDVIAADTYITLTDNGNGTITLDVELASITRRGLMSSSDKVKLNASTPTDTANAIVQRDANGDFSAGQVTVDSIVLNSAINGATPGNHAVTKTYVDALVQSGITVSGGIDCSTNPNYPSASSGDAYYVTVAGKIGGASGENVDAGDLIIAINDNAGGDEVSVGADWIVVERNIEYATESTAGYIQIATQAEVDAGVDNTKAVTPAKLAAALVGYEGGAVIFAADVGLGDTTKTFIVNHAMDEVDVQVQIKDTSTLELVEADVEITDSNNVTVSFNKAPALNEYRVIIHG